jgi:hypothetical protein
MAAPKNHQKWGGRQKGVSNKDTTTIRKFLAHVTDNNRERFEQELSLLGGKDYVTAFLQLLEYSTPKLARVEYTDDTDTKVNIDFSKYSKEELEQLRSLLDK